MDSLETTVQATKETAGPYKFQKLVSKKLAKLSLAYFINYSIGKCYVTALDIYLTAWIKLTDGKPYPTE